MKIHVVIRFNVLVSIIIAILQTGYQCTVKHVPTCDTVYGAGFMNGVRSIKQSNSLSEMWIFFNFRERKRGYHNNLADILLEFSFNCITYKLALPIHI